MEFGFGVSHWQLKENKMYYGVQSICWSIAALFGDCIVNHLIVTVAFEVTQRFQVPPFLQAWFW